MIRNLKLPINKKGESFTTEFLANRVLKLYNKKNGWQKFSF